MKGELAQAQERRREPVGVRSEHPHEEGQGTRKRSRTVRGYSGGEGEGERGGQVGSSGGSGSSVNGPPGDGPGGRAGG